MDKTRYTIGIDEVGRGPIAGPVCVCAFKIKASLNIKAFQKASSKKVLGSPRGVLAVSARPFRQNFYEMPLRDSKKLSPKQREAWFTEIKKWQKEGKCDFALTYISAKEIDKIGIAPAIKKALEKCLQKLYPALRRRGRTSPGLGGGGDLILLDGGLKAPKEFINQKTIIKGDEKEVAIALASIVAKVSRDALMKKHAKKYPNYGFEIHKGYGTKKHYEALGKHGFTPLHRATFLKKYRKQ
jgi:ribonuclease HII